MLCLCGDVTAERRPLRAGARRSCEAGAGGPGPAAPAAGDPRAGDVVGRANVLLGKATALLATLAQSPGAARPLPRGGVPLPASEICQAAGLAFIFTHKVCPRSALRWWG